MSREYLRIPIKERLEKNSEPGPNGCILFIGGTTNGYGRIFDADKKSMRAAHRVAYEVYIGPIEDALVIHHICGVPQCINPEHLQAVTATENSAEMLERHSYLTEISEKDIRISELELENEQLKQEIHGE